MLALVLLVSGAYGIEVTVTGSDGGTTSSDTMSLTDVSDTSGVLGSFTVTHNGITPAIEVTGSPLVTDAGDFSQYHYVQDSSGKRADVSATINGAASFSYRDWLYPSEGTIPGSAVPSVSAAQYVSVDYARYIGLSASATSSDGKTAGVSTQIQYGSLPEYLAESAASSNMAVASQQIQRSSTVIPNGHPIIAEGWASDGVNNFDVKTTSNAFYGTTYAEGSSNSYARQDIGYANGWYTPNYVMPQVEVKRKTSSGTQKVTLLADYTGWIPGGSALSSMDNNLIQNMVDIASVNDHIAIDTGTYAGNIVINKNLLVTGQGAGGTIIDGRLLDGPSLFTIGPGVNVNLQGMTITRGWSGAGGLPFNPNGGKGGGIYNEGTLGITDCVISGNNAMMGMSGMGGGIYNANHGSYFTPGSVTLTRTTVSGNWAGMPSDPTATGIGGGIYNEPGAMLTVNKGSSISGNQATNGAGIANYGSIGIYGATITGNVATGLGGGILNQGSGYLNVQDSGTTHSTISNNQAKNGAGLYNAAGGLSDIYNANIASNTANQASGAGGEGGAIYNANGATLNIYGSTISNNEAKAGTYGGGGGIANYGTANVLFNTIINGNNKANSGLGGGILNSNSLTVDSSTISGNSALYGGALFNKASATITNSQLYSNTATRLGGAIENKQGATITIEDSRINSNTAGWDGGALANYGTATVTSTSPLRSVIYGNTARNGGGVFNYMGTTTLTGVDISSNTANVVSGVGGEGGGAYNYNGATLNINGGTISNNEAKAGTSGGGGGIANYGTTNVLNGAIINGNNRANSGLGGGILNSNRLTVDSSTISGNSALYGGALFNKATATITNSDLYSNYATRLGGAIENKQGATITIEDSRINSNTAGWDGGALANYGTATVTSTSPLRSVIYGNTARNGGGVFNYMGTTTLTAVRIHNNNANQNGGGVYNYNTGTLWMDSNTIDINRANLAGGSYHGGGLYNLGTLHETGDYYFANTPDDHWP